MGGAADEIKAALKRANQEFTDISKATYEQVRPSQEPAKKRAELDVDQQQTAAVEKRVSLEERLAEVQQEADRKRMDTQQQINELIKEEADLRARLNMATDPKDQKALEDQIVNNAKEVESLKNQQEKERLQAEKEAAQERDRASKEEEDRQKRIADLREQLHEKELSRLSKEQQLAENMKQLQEMASRNESDPEKVLQLQLEAANVYERIVQEQQQSMIRLQSDSTRNIGGTLAGVNYNQQYQANLEATKQTDIQRQALEVLQQINAKSYVVEVPESES